MKTFKIADISISISLILTFAIAAIITQSMYVLLMGYVSVAAWHIISLVVHSLKHWFTQPGSNRYIYEAIVSILILLFFAGILIPMINYVLFMGLLFCYPLFAVYYVWICYHELKVKMRRPLSLLK
ncbi:MAG: hypothetical protein JST81_14200 [Bacteroidetes bacterium]|jgi:hypothetical protein|nr:hypothetical protein [Bacteroidota bacterium]